MGWSKEDRLALCLSWPEPDKQAIENLAQTADWTKVRRAAWENGVFGLAYKNIEKLGVKIAPREKDKLQELYVKNSGRNLIIYNHLQKILSGFNKSGVSCIPFKGAELAEQVYWDISLRPMNDVDILIRKNDLPIADETLKTLGFTPYADYDVFLKNTGSSYLNSVVYRKTCGPLNIFIHLHWHIFNATTPLFEETLRLIDLEDLWGAARGRAIMGEKTLSLSPEHNIIYLCLHAFKHSYSHFIFLSDIAQILSRQKNLINWDMIVRDVDRWQLNNFVYCSLYLTNRLYGRDTPEKTLLAVKPENISWGLRKLILLIANHDLCPNLREAAYFFTRKNLREKIVFLKKTFFMPPKDLSHRFSISNAPATFKNKTLRFVKGLAGGINTFVFFLWPMCWRKKWTGG